MWERSVRPPWLGIIYGINIEVTKISRGRGPRRATSLETKREEDDEEDTIVRSRTDPRPLVCPRSAVFERPSAVESGLSRYALRLSTVHGACGLCSTCGSLRVEAHVERPSAVRKEPAAAPRGRKSQRGREIARVCPNKPEERCAAEACERDMPSFFPHPIERERASSEL